MMKYSGLTLNQDKATKPQTVQIVRQGEATPYWFKVNPLYFLFDSILNSVALKKKHPDSFGIQVLSFSSLPYTLAAAATSAA